MKIDMQTSAQAVMQEGFAYFVGSLVECAAFINGYNYRQTDDGDPVDFQIVAVQSLNLRKSL